MEIMSITELEEEIIEIEKVKKMHSRYYSME